MKQRILSILLRKCDALLDAAFDKDKADDCDFSSISTLTDAIINW